MKSVISTLLLIMLAMSGIPALADDLADQEPGWLTQEGLRYQHGEGVIADVDEAVRHYCEAARRDYPLAQYQLGLLYMHGGAIAINEAQAAAWFSLAAEQGDSYAKKMLHFVAGSGEAERPQCLLSDGSELMAPLQSIPDPSPEQIRAWVERLAPEYRLQAELVLEVIRAESNFNPRALSPKNAHGLMQLIPATAERFGVADIWDPLQNIRGGMAYLTWLLDYFDGDLEHALAGYNAGEAAVIHYQGVPPYRETRRYVQTITRRLQVPHSDS